MSSDNLPPSRITHRQSGSTIERTATLVGCSISQVKRVWAIHQTQKIRDISRLGWFTIPVNFLSEDQKAGYDNYHGELTKETLARYFHLDDFYRMNISEK